jgi:sec-independent protein translocase protein TatB
MFDIGFSELLLIGVVALVVIGPEKLPRVARTMGHLFGRLQRYVTQVKSDINREMDLSELKGAKTEFENAARSFQQDIESKAADTEREIRDVQAQIDREMQPQPQDASSELVREPAAAAEPSSPQLELEIEDTYPAGQAPRKIAG